MQSWSSLHFHRLQEIKDDISSTAWFKDHSSVFSSPDELGNHNIVVPENEKDTFLSGIYHPYIQSGIDHIRVRLDSTDVVAAFSVFSPTNLSDSEQDLF